MQGQRWLVMTAHDLPKATAALAFSELEDVLVAVDHRGVEVEGGLWMRAVHLMLVSDHDEATALQASSGITQVVACLLYTSPSPRDLSTSRMPSSA